MINDLWWSIAVGMSEALEAAYQRGASDTEVRVSAWLNREYDKESQNNLRSSGDLKRFGAVGVLAALCCDFADGTWTLMATDADTEGTKQ